MAVVGLFSLYMASIALAAPEDPKVEEEAKKAGIGMSVGELLEQGGTSSVSGNGLANTKGNPEGEDAKAEGENASPIPPGRRQKPLIIVDPGHGGMDEGCSFDGVQEKEINLQIGLILREKLEEMGYQVWMTRDTDTYVAKEARVIFANLCRADAYVSIHQNTYEDVRVCGVETWYDGTDPMRDSQRLAKLLHRYVLLNTGANGREERDDAQFCVTGKTRMPACLVETGFLSNEKEREKLVTPGYQEKIAQGIAEGMDLFFCPKTMYLTFDDGPSAQNTEAVLDILKEKNICATFFLVGENVRKYPEVAKRIAEEGHTIGIHCDSHDYQKIYESVDSYLEDFEAAHETVLETTGVDAKLFRFPGGSVNAYDAAVGKEIAERMTQKGYVYFDWNASLEDAVKKSTPQKLIDNATESTLGRKKVVMLAHDVVDNTVLCLEELLGQFPEYRMEPLGEEVSPIQFRMP